jgi:hypothetical protein
VTLESGLERDLKDGCARSQEQPSATIEPEPALMRGRRFAEQLHHQPMKLPPGETGGPRHRVDRLWALRRIQSAPKSPDCLAIVNRSVVSHCRDSAHLARRRLDLSCLFGVTSGTATLLRHGDGNRSGCPTKKKAAEKTLRSSAAL